MTPEEYRLQQAQQQAARLVGLPDQLRQARATYEAAQADLDQRLAAQVIGRDWHARQTEHARATLAAAVETARSVQAEALTAVRANLDGLTPEETASPDLANGVRLPATMRIARGLTAGAAGPASLTGLQAQAAGVQARAGAYGRLVDVLAESARQLALGSPVPMTGSARLSEAYAEADAVRAVAAAEGSTGSAVA